MHESQNQEIPNENQENPTCIEHKLEYKETWISQNRMCGHQWFPQHHDLPLSLNFKQNLVVQWTSGHPYFYKLVFCGFEE